MEFSKAMDDEELMAEFNLPESTKHSDQNNAATTMIQFIQGKHILNSVKWTSGASRKTNKKYAQFFHKPSMEETGAAKMQFK